MTDTTLQHPTLAQEAQNVSFALRELALATRRLVSALWATTTQRREPCPKETARQEADKLRAYADSLYRADPRYAQDLYAAATRHEMEAAAKA
ncbi:hypothetical protein [Rhodoferax sp.]|uniref:hypothetical protein n=1 Tax=Rhodoferax sp. TaxID=50421 RepID=UPI002842075F|nr:hypothetical protein [Rhodoferax sp.]MDR3370478.1 hypothetical protein [Rhodoferax sp.]